MKKRILFLSMVVFGASGTFAQTPYDTFAPEQSVKSMIELPKMQFKVTNTDPSSEIRYVEFENSTLSLNLLDENDSVIKTIALNPNDKKFLTPDPLAEKYPWLSPYAYCANNPVNATDPTGMWIQYNDSTGYYRYENGQWNQYQQQGKDIGKYTAYTPQQGSFLEGVLNGLNALANNSETGKNLLDYFANDNNDIFIKSGNKNAADFNSHDVYLDANFKGNLIPTEGGVTMSPFWLDIGHELAHQQDFQKNGIPQAQAPWLTMASDGVDVATSEKYATHIENQIRIDAGLSLRTHYVSQGFGGYPKSAILNNGVSIFYGTNYRLHAMSRKLNQMNRLR